MKIFLSLLSCSKGIVFPNILNVHFVTELHVQDLEDPYKNNAYTNQGHGQCKQTLSKVCYADAPSVCFLQYAVVRCEKLL